VLRSEVESAEEQRREAEAGLRAALAGVEQEAAGVADRCRELESLEESAQRRCSETLAWAEEEGREALARTEAAESEQVQCEAERIRCSFAEHKLEAREERLLAREEDLTGRAAYIERVRESLESVVAAATARSADALESAAADRRSRVVVQEELEELRRERHTGELVEAVTSLTAQLAARSEQLQEAAEEDQRNKLQIERLTASLELTKSALQSQLDEGTNKDADMLRWEKALMLTQQELQAEQLEVAHLKKVMAEKDREMSTRNGKLSSALAEATGKRDEGRRELERELAGVRQQLCDAVDLVQKLRDSADKSPRPPPTPAPVPACGPAENPVQQGSEALRTELAAARKQRDAARKQAAAVADQEDRLRRECRGLQEELNEAKHQAATLEASVSVLAGEKAAADTQLATQRSVAEEMGAELEAEMLRVRNLQGELEEAREAAVAAARPPSSGRLPPLSPSPTHSIADLPAAIHAPKPPPAQDPTSKKRSTRPKPVATPAVAGLASRLAAFQRRPL